LHPLFAALGYNGTDPIADHWLTITPDASGTGTNLVVDSHNAQAPVIIVDIVGVAPTSFHEGTTHWTLMA
jgi:hypothetical protein